MECRIRGAVDAQYLRQDYDYLSHDNAYFSVKGEGRRFLFRENGSLICRLGEVVPNSQHRNEWDGSVSVKYEVRELNGAKVRSWLVDESSTEQTEARTEEIVNRYSRIQVSNNGWVAAYLACSNMNRLAATQGFLDNPYTGKKGWAAALARATTFLIIVFNESVVLAIAVQLTGARFGFLTFLVVYSLIWPCIFFMAPDPNLPPADYSAYEPYVIREQEQGQGGGKFIFAALFLIGLVRLIAFRKAGLPDDILFIVLVAAIPFAPLFLVSLPWGNFSLDAQPLYSFIGFVTILAVSPAVQWLLNVRRALPRSPLPEVGR
jgi:hypothetical protein